MLALAVSAVMLDDAFAASGPSMRVMARIGGAEGPGSDRMVKNGGVLRSGDELQLRLRSEQDAYVYVIAYGSSNTAMLLHPFSGGDEEALVRAGEERVFPREGMYLPLDQRLGRETLYLVGSTVPLTDITGLFPRMEAQGDDVVAVTRVLRGAYPDVSQVSFRHIGAKPLVGVDLAGVRKSITGVAAPPPGSSDQTRSPEGTLVLPATTGWSVPSSAQSFGTSTEAAAGDAAGNEPTDTRGKPGSDTAAGTRESGESDALRRAKEAAGIDPGQFQGILSALPSGGDGEIPESLRGPVREEGVLSAEGSRIRALGAGQPKTGELGLN
jgi:hypothetical protein